MGKLFKIRLIVSVFFLFFVTFGFLLTNDVHSAGTYPITGKAKVMNTDKYLYFDSTLYNSNVTVSDPVANVGTMTGYVWSEDLGWIDFGDSDNGGPVTVDYTTGVLSGRAYVINTGGFIDFSGDDFNANVLVNSSTGAFSGYAWSDDVGWIDFADTGVTDTRLAPTSSSTTTTTTSGSCDPEQFCSTACGRVAVDLPNGSCGYKHCDPTVPCSDPNATQLTLPDTLPASGSHDILNWLKIGLATLGLGLIFLLI